MPKGKHSPVLVWSAAIFIALEVAAIAMLQHSSPLRDIWINRSSHKVIAKVWGGAQRLSDYFSLQDKNLELAEENAKLMSMILEADSERIPEIPEDLACKRYSYTIGRIVKMSLNSNHNFIIIDKGSEDGIGTNCGIITPYGVVGTVNSVSDHYSYGLTLMNPRINISARLGRGGVVSPLFWDGVHSDRAILDAIPIKYDVVPGDTVWTSGFSTLFPPDIPIGTVRERRSDTGADASAVIDLFQDFATLDYVLIVKNLDSPEIDALEKNGKEDRI